MAEVEMVIGSCCPHSVGSLQWLYASTELKSCISLFTYLAKDLESRKEGSENYPLLQFTSTAQGISLVPQTN